MKKSKKEIVYKQVCEDMKRSGYTENALVIPSAKVFILGTVISLFPTALLFVLYRLVHGLQPDFALDYPIFCIQIILSLVIHELVHGIGWMIGGKCKWNEIEFGISSLFPYCYCKKPLSRKQYLIGVLMPIVLLGLGTTILALVFESLSLLVLAIINVIIAGGDLIIVVNLRKTTKLSLVMDHPYKAGFVAFEK